MEFKTWHDVFVWLIMIIVLLSGAPVSQLIKLALQKIFGTGVYDAWAVVVTGVTSFVLAMLEMWLSGNLMGVTVATFPTWLSGILFVASLYWQLFKGSETFLGTKGLLRQLEPPKS
jgi:hypothetical protein